MAVERRVDVGGCQLAYQDDRVEGKVPYVLLHGWLRNRYTWRDLYPALVRSGESVIAVDLPGFGNSDIPDADYSLEYFTRTVVGFLDAMGIQKARLVGHGLGGAVAFAIGLDQPQRVERIFSMSPSWGENPMVGLRGRFVLAGPLGSTLFNAAMNRERVEQLLLKQHYHEPIRVDDALVDSVWDPLSRPGGKAAAYKALMTDMNPGLSDRMDQLQVPTCVVWGYNDRIHPIDLGKRLETINENIVLRQVPNSGYMCHETRPRSIAIYMNGYLGTNIDIEQIQEGHPRPGTANFV